MSAAMGRDGSEQRWLLVVVERQRRQRFAGIRNNNSAMRVWRRVAPELSRAALSWQIVEAACEGYARQLVESFDLSRFEAIVVLSGGDELANEVIITWRCGACRGPSTK